MKRCLVAVLLLFPVGCERLSGGSGGSRGLLPQIPTPTRPVLRELTPTEQVEIKEKLKPQTAVKIKENFEALHLYTSKLEIGIAGYNNYVRVNNALVRQQLGLPQEKVEIKAESVKLKEEEK